jgi:hypothetical protein
MVWHARMLTRIKEAAGCKGTFTQRKNKGLSRIHPVMPEVRQHPVTAGNNILQTITHSSE